MVIIIALLNIIKVKIVSYYFYIFFAVIFSYAKANIVISQKDDIFNDISTLIYEDTTAKLSFQQVQQIKDFKKYSNKISQGYSKSAFWIKFDIYNNTSSNLEYFIKFTETYQDTIDCYILSNDGTFKRQYEGAGYFIENKKIN